MITSGLFVTLHDIMHTAILDLLDTGIMLALIFGSSAERVEEGCVERRAWRTSRYLIGSDLSSSVDQCVLSLHTWAEDLALRSLYNSNELLAVQHSEMEFLIHQEQNMKASEEMQLVPAATAVEAAQQLWNVRMDW